MSATYTENDFLATANHLLTKQLDGVHTISSNKRISLSIWTTWDSDKKKSELFNISTLSILDDISFIPIALIVQHLSNLFVKD